MQTLLNLVSASNELFQNVHPSSHLQINMVSRSMAVTLAFSSHKKGKIRCDIGRKISKVKHYQLIWKLYKTDYMYARAKTKLHRTTLYFSIENLHRKLENFF